MSSGNDPWNSMSSFGSGKSYLDGKTTTSVQFTKLIDFISSLSDDASQMIAQIRSKKSAMSVADMFQLQMAMNKLSQSTEMSSGMVAAINGAISAINRNLKG